MRSLGIKIGNNQQISVEMGDLSLTKRSRRLKVNIGAVLRTRMNTGDYHLVKASGMLAGRRNGRLSEAGREMGERSCSIRFIYF
jgi:hypothetical protein